MAILRTTFLTCTHLFLCLSLALSVASDELVKCSSEVRNCTVTNWLGSFPDRSICKAGEAAYPATEAELIAVVASATENSRKMKVVTRHAHSTTKLICPDGEDGLLISTRYLNKIVSVDRSAMTMTVESGLLFKELIKAAADVGLALPHSPYWSGVTVGGLLSTGSHGSTLWGKGPAVHENVVEIRMISPGAPKDVYVKVRNVNATSHDFDAVKLSLGVLGVVSQVTFQLEPIFKRSITLTEKDDHGLEDQIISFGKSQEFGYFVWYPKERKVIYRIDDRVPSDVPGNGRFDPPVYHPKPISTVEPTAEEDSEVTRPQEGKCTTSKTNVTLIVQSGAFGLTNDGESFSGYPVIGYQNDIQSYSGCLDGPEGFACSWDHRIKGRPLFDQMSLSVTLSDAKSFFKDLKELFGLISESTCGVGLTNGILMRYVTASSVYLGKEEDSIEFDLTSIRSRDSKTPRFHEDIFEELEQMAAFKYGGLPHWGKNRNVAFDGAVNKYKDAGRFLKVKERYDPMGLFSSRWTDQMLGLQGGLTEYKEGCALEGLCICSKDNHCAPEKGYFCRPGKVYKEARVCTLLDSHNKHTEL